MKTQQPVDKGIDKRTHQSEWLCFKIANETYTHDVLVVDEVLRYSEPTPVPGSPNHVLGILNIRGNVVSVFSGRQLLGLNEIAPTDNSRIIIFKMTDELFGIAVDSVVEIAYFSKTEIEEGATQHQSHSFLKGTVNQKNKLLITVDFSFIND